MSQSASTDSISSLGPKCRPHSDTNMVPTSIQYNLDGDQSTTTAGTAPPTALHPVPFTTYREYIKFLKDGNSKFKWLHKFFKAKSRPNSSLEVLDCSDGCIREQADITRATLESPPVNVSRRIILFTYQSISDVDRSALDDLAYALDLDPTFLWYHFHHDRSFRYTPWRDNPKSDLPASEETQCPLSERVSLDISLDCHEFERLSVMIVQTPIAPWCQQIILFCASTWTYELHRPLDGCYSMRKLNQIPQESIRLSTKEHYKQFLKTSTHEKVSEAEHHPIQLLIPYVRLLLNYAVKEIEILRTSIIEFLDPDSADRQLSELDSEPELLFEVIVLMQRLTTSLASLQNFVKLQKSSNLNSVLDLISDFKDLQQEVAGHERAIRDYTHRKVAVLALEESRKSIQMADSVKTLTQLAFVFVPMTFGVAIFGANVREFGSGTAPLWVLVTTVLVISAVTVLLWGTYYGPFISYARNTGPWIRLLTRFGLRNPIGALWLLVFVMSHSREFVMPRIRTLSLRPGEYIVSRTDILTSEYWRKSFLDSKWERFWKNRLCEVALFTVQEGWGDNYFHRRFIQKFAAKRDNAASSPEQGDGSC